MNDRDASRLLRGLLKSHGQTVAWDPRQVLHLSSGDVDLRFEFVERTLRCQARVHDFRRPPRSDFLEALSPPQVGRFVLDEQRLSLEHTQRGVVSVAKYIREIDRLLEENRRWVFGQLINELESRSAYRTESEEDSGIPG